LAQICAATDRVQALADQIDAEGATVLVRGVAKPHPLLRDELQNRAFITRNLQRLGLLSEPINPVGRPPGKWGA
jgi:hypothetical protein